MSTCVLLGLVSASLTSLVNSALLRSAPSQVEVKLLNDDDLSMMATVQLGNQEVRCIMDTGSAEQVIFSNQCEECGKNMFKCDKDPSCKWGSHKTVQSYGSGETYSTEAHADMTLTSMDGKESIDVKGQMVWLVTEAELDFEMDGIMQCIFGLGPASSAVEFAKIEATELARYLKSLPKDEQEEYEPVLKSLKEHVGFMKGVTLWQTAAASKSFSFCLHPEFGQDGRIILHDQAPNLVPHAFAKVATIPVHGEDLYWSLPMKHAQIQFHGNSKVAGCGSDGCTAIMDTGTSLIGAPGKYVEDLNDLLEKYVPKWGCEQEGLSKYPDFTFQLGDHAFTLPPRAYVCQFEAADWDDEDEWDSGKPAKEVKKRMPHLGGFRKMHEERVLEAGINSTQDYFCAPCFFQMDDGDQGESHEWLFGLPFFREYYSNFETSSSVEHTKAMRFAKASPDCKVHKSKAKDMQENPKHSVQRIHMHKLRLPPLKKNSKKLSFRHMEAL